MRSRGKPRTAGAAVVVVLLTILTAIGWLVTRSAGLGASSLAGRTGASAAAKPASPPATGDAAPLHLVGFGDSVLAGAGCSCDDFLVQAANRLQNATGRRVTTANRGVNGETTQGLLSELRTDDAATQLGQADVIVLTIGANDLQSALDSWEDEGCSASCYRPQIAAMTDRLDAVLATVDHAKMPDAVVLVTNYWNVYADGDVGKRMYGSGFITWSDQVTRAANKAICQAAQDHQATCVDLYQPFKGKGDDDPTHLLADDGDHANDRGTATISRTVVAAIEKALPTAQAH